MGCLSLFLEARRRTPGAVALIDQRGPVTFDALGAAADVYAARLCKAGVRRGDRVVVLVPMSVELYTWLIALLRIDATVMFVEPWMPLPLIAGVCESAAPAALLASPAGVLLAQRIPAFRKIPLRLSTRWGGVLRVLGWRAPPDTGAPLPTMAASDDDVAVLTFTTGSSGAPKSVVRTHGLLQTQHDMLTASLKLTPSDVCLHVFANFILNNLALGAASVIPNIQASAPTSFNPRALMTQIATNAVTSVVCPPASLQRMVDSASRHGIILPTVKRLATGGGVVPRALLEAATRVFVNADPEVLYGSSEVEPVSHIAWSELKTLSGDGVCVGRPVPQIAVRLMDFGEIAVRGPHVSPAYLNNPEATAKTKFQDENGHTWHRMGDLATQDAEGRLWLTGRRHTLIQTPTGPVFPMILEQRAERLSFVDRAAATERTGQRGSVVMVIVPKAWAPGSFNAWAAQLQRELPEAGSVVFLKEIPRDRRHRSKIDDAALQRQLRAAGPGLS